MAGPLSGLRVIDVSTVIAGNVASSMLADFGAEVIKVEHPNGGDSNRALQPFKNGVSLQNKVAGRNKKSITLNLGVPDGQSIFRKLATSTEILIENFRPGTLERWGLGWTDLQSLNPGLVMLRISGYGQDGPYASRPGFGTIAEGLSGLAHRTGQADGPPIFASMSLADSVTGIFGAFSVMFAVYQRDHGDGTGQMIDLALYEGLFRLVEDQVISYDQLGIVLQRMGNRVMSSAPRGAFRTRDGKWVAVSAFSDATVRRLLRTIGGDGLAADARFSCSARRVENVDALEKLIADWIAQRDRDTVLETLERDDVVVGPIFDISEIFKNPQFNHRQNIVGVQDPDLGPVRVPGLVPKFSKTPGAIEHLSLPLGGSNEEIYCGRLGMSRAQLDLLKSNGVI